MSETDEAVWTPSILWGARQDKWPENALYTHEGECAVRSDVDWNQSVERHIGDVRVYAPRAVTRHRMHAYIIAGGGAVVTVARVTARQRRLCLRDGHPAENVIVSWWDSDGVSRYHRALRVCSRCGAELARDVRDAWPDDAILEVL